MFVRQNQTILDAYICVQYKVMVTKAHPGLQKTNVRNFHKCGNCLGLAWVKHNFKCYSLGNIQRITLHLEPLLT